jgi:alpha-tubulin suppressor-like RCC1 family protein
LIGTTGTLLFSGVCYKASKENLLPLSNNMAFADEASHMVFGWGSSKQGQLGQGNEKPSVTEVTSIVDLSSMTIKQLIAKNELSAAINSYGELYTWGSSRNGSQVDANGTPYEHSLKLPQVFASMDHQFVSGDVGRDHQAFITHDGQILVMGSDDYGKLGLGEKKEENLEESNRGFRYSKSENRLHTKSAQTNGRMGIVNLGGKKAK